MWSRTQWRVEGEEEDEGPWVDDEQEDFSLEETDVANVALGTVQMTNRRTESVSQW